MAAGAAYVAPVVTTLAAPAALRAQGHSETSTKGGMGEGMSVVSTGIDPSTSDPASGAARAAPWEVRSRSLPGTSTGGSGATGGGSAGGE